MVVDSLKSDLHLRYDIEADEYDYEGLLPDLWEGQLQKIPDQAQVRAVCLIFEALHQDHVPQRIWNHAKEKLLIIPELFHDQVQCLHQNNLDGAELLPDLPKCSFVFKY